ncbi:MAG: hypothetical protein ABIJ96_07830 [Elusimicrobiota bacterium]
MIRRYWSALLAAAAAAVLSAPLDAAAGSYGAAAAADEPVVVHAKVDYLDSAVDDLRDAVRNDGYSDNDVHAKASVLFGSIVRKDSTAIGTLHVRGWAKPSIHTTAFRTGQSRENITVDGMSAAVYKTLMASDVPPPTEIMDAYVYGEDLEKDGLKNYDDGKILGRGQLGVYMYRGSEKVGVYFNKFMRSVQAWVGNEFAAATDMHESAHSRDHTKGELNPVEVRRGEVLAYKTEYLWLNLMDPTGQKLSWARATFGKFAQGADKAPEFVSEYLEHLAKIRYYGNKDDFLGLVDELGYRDKHNHAGAPHGSDAPGRRDDAEKAERPGEEDGPPALVQYVNFPG